MSRDEQPRDDAGESDGHPTARADMVPPGVAALAGSCLSLVVSVGAAAWLGRVLTPEQYGVFAMAAISLAVLTALTELGVIEAIVRAPTIDAGLTRGLLGLSLMGGVLSSMMMAALGPVLAFAFDEEGVIVLALALSPAPLLVAVSAVPLGLLQRSLRFGSVARTRLVADALAAVGAIASAELGAGVLSLVVFAVGRVGVLAVLVIWTARGPLIPGWLDARGVQQLRFGGPLSATKALSVGLAQVDRALIAVFFEPAALGIYTRAAFLVSTPVNTITAPLASVGHAALSPLVANANAFRLRLRRGLTVMGWLALPPLAVGFTAAGPALSLALGPQWSGGAGVMRGLVLVGVAQVLGSATQWVFVATGRTGRQLVWRIVSGVVCVASLIASARHGPEALAWTLGVVLLVLRIPGTLVCSRGTPMHFFDAFRPFFEPVAAGVIGSALAVGLASALSAPQDGPAWLALTGVCVAATSATMMTLSKDGRMLIGRGAQLVRAIVGLNRRGEAGELGV
ncbi:MAG: oligosaccharide flippase family protein [Planctomycetota bacterium]